MKKINVAELLKDCPKGMELNCTNYNGIVTFVKIIDCAYYPIEIDITYGGEHFQHTLTKYGESGNTPYNKCIIFPKGKTTWEGFQRPFKDGDVVAGGNCSCSWVAIYKGFRDKSSYYFHSVYTSLGRFRTDDYGDSSNLRFATKEEEEKLFNEIKRRRYKWNPETKKLEILIKPMFKDGDVVVCCEKYPFIYSGEDDKYWHCHCGVYVGTNEIGFGDKRWIGKSFNIRLANNEEKEKLFQLIRENGYKWVSETKSFERLIEPMFKVGDIIQDKNTLYKIKIKDVKIGGEYYVGESVDGVGKGVGYFYFCEQDKWELVRDKFNINTLKPYDRVLVRFGSGDIWRINLLERYDETSDNPFLCIGYQRFKQCIPYEGNEHLLGTHNDCNEFFKTWEE